MPLGARTFPAQSFPPDGTTFSQTSLGKRLTQEIPPYGYWNMQFYHPEAAYVKFEYTIPRGASIGVYARRNALPTHTQYDILEVLSGFKARTTRAAHVGLAPEVEWTSRLMMGFSVDCEEGSYALHGARPLVPFSIQRRWRCTGNYTGSRSGWRYDP